jgi:chitosanase
MQAPSRIADTTGISSAESVARDYFFKKRKSIVINPDPASMIIFQNFDGKVKNGMTTRLHLKERWTGSVRLDYRVKFSSGFRWGGGGQLPGLLGGRWWCTPTHRSSQCWRVQVGWTSNGEVDIVTKIPQAKRNIALRQTVKFSAGDWTQISIIVNVNTGSSSNGEVQVLVNGNVIANDDALLFSRKSTRSVYVLMSGKYNDDKNIPETPNTGELDYVLAKSFSASQVQRVFPSPPPPPPLPSPPPPVPSPSPSPEPTADNSQDTEWWNPDSPITTPTGPYVWEELTADQYRRMLMLTSIFENSKLDLQYGFCKNIGDGRGFTFGFCGFVTKHVDARRVLTEYLKMKPDDLLMAQFLEIMKQPSPGSDGTSKLGGFCEAVQALGDDESFRQAQHIVQKSMYYDPSKVWSQKIGARYALTKGQMYDAMINHGQGLKDPFSIDHIVEKTAVQMGGYPLDGVDEVQWLNTFLTIRAKTISDLENWQTKRIDYYRALLDGGNLNLDGPIYVTTEKKGNGWTIANVYFGRFEIYNLQNYSIIE